MDLDIFKVKCEKRDYSFINDDSKEGFKLYKPFSIKRAEIDGTIYTSPLSGEVGFMAAGFNVYVDKFDDKQEVRIATVVCRSLDEMDDVLSNLDKVIEGNGSDPFVEIITKTNLKICKRRNAWVAH